MATSIRFVDVSKHYGNLCVIDRLNLDIEEGEFISLLGPSGSGKTTLLMMLAGFTPATGGQIIVDGKIINAVPTHRRDMGVVFQDYALFPHMDVARNVAFPLQMRGLPKADIASRVSRALDMVQLGALAGRRPSQLSGGQQQRVALARALIFEPRIVLMDEPLGALDKNLREQMQFDIRALHRRLGLTVVFVTHDQGEALTMSNRIALFNRGRVEQVGSPREIYDEPTTRFAAQFIGETNLLDGTIDAIEVDSLRIKFKDGATLRARASADLAVGQAIQVLIRPERIELTSSSLPSTDRNLIRATAGESVYQGNHVRVELQTDSYGPIIARVDRKAPEPPPGTVVDISFNVQDCRVIAR